MWMVKHVPANVYNTNIVVIHRVNICEWSSMYLPMFTNEVEKTVDY
jgi:hypothetical protein